MRKKSRKSYAFLANHQPMTAGEYMLAMHRLGLTHAQMANWLQVNLVTSYRHANGSAPIPFSTACLLRALLELGVRPQWQAPPNGAVVDKLPPAQD